MRSNSYQCVQTSNMDTKKNDLTQIFRNRKNKKAFQTDTLAKILGPNHRTIKILFLTVNSHKECVEKRTAKLTAKIWEESDMKPPETRSPPVLS